MTDFSVPKYVLSKMMRWVEGANMRLVLRAAGVRDAWRIPSFTSRAELISLYRLAKLCPIDSVVVEIGSYLGKSSCYLLAGCKQSRAKLICVDTWGNETMPDGERNTFQEFRENTRGASSSLLTLRKRSDQLSINDIPKKAALIFIDGDHGYDAAKSDALVAEQMLDDDGIIAFHDATTFEGVSAVIGELLTSKKWVLVGVTESLCWIARSKFAPWPSR